jgi:hypothetical protein
MSKKKPTNPIEHIIEEVSPSPLSIGIIRTPGRKKEERLVKHSKHLLNSKTSSEQYDRERKGIPTLFDSLPIEQKQELEEASITFVGVSLQPNEERLLAAIQQLLRDTNYKGNSQLRKQYNEDGKREPYPVLEVSPHSLIAAYTGSPKYSGKEIKNTTQALASLVDKKFYWSYNRREQDGTESQVKHLGSLIPDYKEISREDGKKYLEITVSPILVDQIDKHYVLYPEDIANRTATHCPGKVIPAVNRLRDYLATQVSYQKSKPSISVKIGYERLIYKLELHYYRVKRRNPKRAHEYLMRAVDTCKNAGALLSFEIKPGVTGEDVCYMEVSTTSQFW